jgi:hypothetical protein
MPTTAARSVNSRARLSGPPGSASVESQVGELPFERGDVVLGRLLGWASGHEGGQLAARPMRAGRPSVYSSPPDPQSSDAAYTAVRTTAARR